jgi:hypothetical protein
LKQNRIWEPYLHRVFEKYLSKNSVVLECGCDIGAHTVKLAKLSRHVHAFEWNPLLVSVLQENIVINELSNVTLYQNKLAQHVLYQEDVPWITIDYLNLENLDFLKVDVLENSDWVLEGALETIRRCLPVILIRNHASTFVDCSLLMNVGYEIGNIEGGEPNTYFLYLPPIDQDYLHL